MTSIINKSKENAIINKKVKNGAVTIEVVGSKKQTVRPIMTVEARDVLNKIHEAVKGETRSESIEWFLIRYINILSQRDSLVNSNHELRVSVKEVFDKQEHYRGGCDFYKAESTKKKKEARQWKLIAWSMAAACVALIATMMLTAS